MTNSDMHHYSHNDSIDVRKVQRIVPYTIVKDSPIAGKGIFAGEYIKKGDHLGWYYGTTHINHPMNGSHYILSVQMKPCWVSTEVWNKRDKSEGLFIDGDPEYIQNQRDCRFSMLNHSSGKDTNVKFLSNGRVVALKNIRPNTELLINYGSDFFEE